MPLRSVLIACLLIALATLLASRVSVPMSKPVRRAPVLPLVPASPPRDASRFHLYLLMGQSNMVGFNRATAFDRKTHPRILMLSGSDAWVLAGNPLHRRADGSYDVDGVGPGLPFARELLRLSDETDVVIGLIPCAVSGSQIAKWQPGSHLWEQAAARAKTAMKHGTLKGVLWHQGESDANDPARRAAYPRHFKSMVEALREGLDHPSLPIVAGELALVGPDWRREYHAAFNAQLHRLADEIDHMAVVSAKGLRDWGDGVHLSADSARVFGKRYARAMAGMQHEE